MVYALRRRRLSCRKGACLPGCPVDGEQGSRCSRLNKGWNKADKDWTRIDCLFGNDYGITKQVCGKGSSPFRKRLVGEDSGGSEKLGNGAERQGQHPGSVAGAEGRIPGTRGGTKLSKFMAREEEIREALAAGYSIKDVYDCLQDEGVIDLSYSLFSEYVRTKLQMRQRQGFERVKVIAEGETVVQEPQLTEEERKRNMMVHGNPGRPAGVKRR